MIDSAQTDYAPKFESKSAAEGLTSGALDALDRAREATLNLRGACDYWETEARRASEDAAYWKNVACAATLRAQHQAETFNQIHQFLLKDDLPTQILRICLELTGAEQGLFTSPNGDAETADIGLEELTHVPRQALLDYTRRAASGTEPVVENNGAALPDGPQLVNLAAVPVTLHDAPAGVLLVANKRSGPFTDADTDTLLAVGRHASTAMRNQRLHTELNEAFQATVAVLADAIMAKDPYTHGHSEDVSELTVKVAQQIGIDGDALDALRYAALLHDIGKIGIPDGILMKPGALTPEERALIERHPLIGSDLISRVAGLRAVAPIVRHHHEKMDGSGYPDGLRGDAIPLPSRIISVVDALNAMTTKRPYRLPMPREEAIAELRRCAGVQFDPHIVETIAGLLAA